MKSEEHHQRFICTMICLECSFLFISFLDPKVIESPSEIYLGKPVTVFHIVKELGDEWETIVIGNCTGI